MPDERDELIGAQKQVIGILFEIVKRLQANADLDDEYFGLVGSGTGGGRLDEILAERAQNAELVGRLLKQLDA